MSIKTLILTALSCIFFITTVSAGKYPTIADAKKDIRQHTEPKYRNTFMVFSHDQIECLAMNVYHEARNESLSGKIGVILVTMNRVADKRFPATICGVVKQGKHWFSAKRNKWYPAKNRCQFSWYCDGRSDKPENKRAWIYSQALTEYFLKRSMLFIDFTEGATHYHAEYISLPRWAKSKDFIKTVRIDTHLFYRWESNHLTAMK